MEQKFRREVLIPEKQAQEKKLKFIRLARVNPINHTEIKRHNIAYQEKVKQLTEQKIKKREDALAKLLPSTGDGLDNYFTRLVRKLEEEK